MKTQTLYIIQPYHYKGKNDINLYNTVETWISAYFTIDEAKKYSYGCPIISIVVEVDKYGNYGNCLSANYIK